MEMLNLYPGSDKWLAARMNHYTASEAPAMASSSKYQKRDDLLKMKSTGIAPEVDSNTQKLFDRGHATEESIRPHIEKIIGAELFPVVVRKEIDGLPLLASMDGLTMLGDIGFEHKLYGEDLANAILNDDLHEHYLIQMEQQFMVTGCEKILFACSDGTPDKLEWMWVYPDKDRQSRIVAGWHQFKKDMETYEVPEYVEPIVAEVVMDLPAVSVKVSGSIDIIDNFKAFGDALRLFVEEQLITQPETDQDFADLEAQIKTLKKAEDALNMAEATMLAQVEAVSTLKASKDMFFKMARDNRLMAEKIVQSKKEEIKRKIVSDAISVIRDFVETINTELGQARLPEMPNNMAQVIKGKRSIDMMRSALNDEIASVKIQANEAASIIRANLKTVNEAGALSLFPDLQAVINTPADHFTLLVNSRIAKQKEEDDRRLESEREKIRQEEYAKVEAERKEAEWAEERKRQDEARKRDFEEQQKAAPIVAEPAQPQTAPTSTVEPEIVKAEVRAPELSPELLEWCDQYRVSKKARAALLEILNK
jgi:predicted phage-related endonuclease